MLVVACWALRVVLCVRCCLMAVACRWLVGCCLCGAFVCVLTCGFVFVACRFVFFVGWLMIAG